MLWPRSSARSRSSTTPAATTTSPPRTKAWVVVQRDDRRAVTSYRWGLIPHWGDGRQGRVADDQRAGRDDHGQPGLPRRVSRKRCLVPVDSFDEWKRYGTVRQPYRIVRRDGRPLALAGLWAGWRDPVDGRVVHLRTPTTTPSEVIAGLHDRMPVLVIDEDAWDRWLDPESWLIGRAAGAAGPSEADLYVYPVERLVNDVRRDGPELIARAGPTPADRTTAGVSRPGSSVQPSAASEPRNASSGAAPSSSAAANRPDHRGEGAIRVGRWRLHHRGVRRDRVNHGRPGGGHQNVRRSARRVDRDGNDLRGGEQPRRRRRPGSSSGSGARAPRRPRPATVQGSWRSLERSSPPRSWCRRARRRPPRSRHPAGAAPRRGSPARDRAGPRRRRCPNGRRSCSYPFAAGSAPRRPMSWTSRPPWSPRSQPSMASRRRRSCRPGARRWTPDYDDHARQRTRGVAGCVSPGLTRSACYRRHCRRRCPRRGRPRCRCSPRRSSPPSEPPPPPGPLLDPPSWSSVPAGAAVPRPPDPPLGAAVSPASGVSVGWGLTGLGGCCRRARVLASAVGSVTVVRAGATGTGDGRPATARRPSPPWPSWRAPTPSTTISTNASACATTWSSAGRRRS